LIRLRAVALVIFFRLFPAFLLFGLEQKSRPREPLGEEWLPKAAVAASSECGEGTAAVKPPRTSARERLSFS